MKTRSQGFVFACFLICAATLFAGTASAANAAAGKIVFNAKCKGCHGEDGQGNPMIAKAMKIEFKPLSSEDVQKSSDADLKAAVTMGTGKMKPVTLPAADLDNVVAYLRTLKK